MERLWNTAFRVERATACGKKTFANGVVVAYCTPHAANGSKKHNFTKPTKQDGTENDGKGKTGE